MAHVQFRSGSATTNDLPVQLLIDGADITTSVLSEGLALDLGDPAVGVKPKITLVVACDTLDVDLPDSVVDVIHAHENPEGV